MPLGRGWGVAPDVFGLCDCPLLNSCSLAWWGGGEERDCTFSDRQAGCPVVPDIMVYCGIRTFYIQAKQGPCYKWDTPESCLWEAFPESSRLRRVWNTLVSGRSLAGCMHLTRFALFCFKRNFVMLSYESLHIHPTCLCFIDFLFCSFFFFPILKFTVGAKQLFSLEICTFLRARWIGAYPLASCSLGLGTRVCPPVQISCEQMFPNTL